MNEEILPNEELPNPVNYEKAKDKYIRTLRSSITINLPQVAELAQISFSWIDAQLSTDQEFFDKVDLCFKRIRFELYETILRQGLAGKSSGVRSCDVSSAQFIIKSIDSDDILKPYRKALTQVEKKDSSKDVKDALEGLV